MTRRWALGALLATIPLALATHGCGGSDRANSTVSVYATDNFNDAYDQVWARLYKVELVDADGAVKVVWEDSDGRVVDLRSLGHRGEGQNRYAYLGTWELDEKDFKYVRTTFAPDIMCMAAGGSGSGESYTIDSMIPRDGNGRAFVTTALTAVRRFGEEPDDLVVDFDLSQFVLQHGKVVPKIVEGNQEGLTSATSHDAYDYPGEITGMTGTIGNQMFHLKNGNWNGLVAVDGNTVLLKREFNAGETVLANGQRVEVHGIFDPITRRIRAQEIKVETPASDTMYRHEIRGTTISMDENDDFLIEVTQVEGFIPEHKRAHLKLAEGVVLQGPNGLAISVATFEATASKSGFEIDVEGSYDAATDTITARRARLLDLQN